MSEATPPVRDQLLGNEVPALVAWPLTVDNLDTDGGNALAPLAASPLVTGVGFVANGYDSKVSGDLPAWACSASARVSVHALIKAAPPVVDWREVAVGVSTASIDQPKIELATLAEPNYPSNSVMALRTFNGSAVVRTCLNRLGWRFEFISPEKPTAAIPLPQSLCWLDSSTLLLAVDVAGSGKSALYRVDAATGEYTGRASSTTYLHLNSMHLAQDGSVWVQCQVGGLDQRKRIDLATSFSTGAITESASWNTGDVPTSSLSFATVGGVEYALLSQHATSGTPRCYVFLRSQMSGTVNQVNRVIRFRVPFQTQDLVQRASNGLLYISRGGSGAEVLAYDLAAILAGTDDATPTPVSTYPAASARPEGLDFHPVTDRLWMCTEGFFGVGDLWSHCSVWSTEMSGSEENAYLVDYVDGEMHVRLNGRLMTRFAHSPGAAPAKISVGSSPPNTPGQTGFMTAGTVRALAIKSVPFTVAELNDLL